MGRAGRSITIALGLALIGAVIVLAPQIADIRGDNAERDRREAAEARERQIANLKELMRARTGTTDTPANPRPDLERLITADARRRPDVNQVLRTECEPIRG